MPGKYPRRVSSTHTQNSMWHSRFKNTPSGGSSTARRTAHTSTALSLRWWSIFTVKDTLALVVAVAVAAFQFNFKLKLRCPLDNNNCKPHCL